MPPLRKALASSHVDTAAAAATMPMKVCRTVSSDRTTTAPSPTPTRIADLRSRPARDGFDAGTSAGPPATCAPITTSARPELIRQRRLGRAKPSGTSDFEELGFLVLHE